MRVTNPRDRYISYRLNILGIRVFHDKCLLVAKDRGGQWTPLPRSHPLPIVLPDNPAEIEHDTLLLTAYQYDLERPGSDLRAVLSLGRPFDEALADPVGRSSSAAAD